MISEIVVCTENLTRDFVTVRAVDSLSLEVPQGIVFGAAVGLVMGAAIDAHERR